jgi:hypothetical protein
MEQRAVELIVGGVPFAVSELRPDPDRPDIDEFLQTVSSLVRQGALALLVAPMSAYGAPREHAWDGDPAWQALVDTIDECATIAVAHLVPAPSASTVPDLPRLVGPTPAIRLVTSYANPVPPLSAIIESTPVRKDYRAFAGLWSASPDPDADLATDPHEAMRQIERKPKVFDIGRAMGEAHDGNMAWQAGHGVTVFDLQPSRWLYAPPTPAQAATTLIPLMSSFSPQDWAHFRAGYVATRGDAGQRVIDLIEARDLTGWMIASRRGDAATAAGLLTEQLAADQELPPTMRPGLESALGVFLSQAGRHEEAVAAHRTALASAGSDHREVVIATVNLGQALVRAGEARAGLEELERVMSWEQTEPTLPGLLEAVQQAVDNARAQIRASH